MSSYFLLICNSSLTSLNKILNCLKMSFYRPSRSSSKMLGNFSYIQVLQFLDVDSSIINVLRFYYYFVICHYLFSLPVLLGLICPTLAPGGAFLFAILGLILFPLPEPNGWSTAFIFTADVLGQSLFLVFFMKCIFPAFTIGFSSLPAPAIVPTTAPHSPWNLFSFF